MGTKEKATEAANPQCSEGKDNKNICIRAKIKAIFRSGKKFTARKINQLTGSNDARKSISTLRRDGWRIQDMRLPDGSKLYWLAEDDRQGVLNFKELKNQAYECKYRSINGSSLSPNRRHRIAGAAVEARNRPYAVGIGMVREQASGGRHLKTQGKASAIRIDLPYARRL